MPLAKPYYLTYRPNLKDSDNYNFYMHRSEYVENPSQYIRIAELLYKDFNNLFDYIEPSDLNQNCYSFRMYELLLRSCTEVESNMKRIMIANGYTKKSDKLKMEDYFKLEATHHLSQYKVFIPNWSGEFEIRTPYAKWQNKKVWTAKGENLPEWYDAYNQVKHSRQDKFEQANLKNALDAYCGFLVLLTAQYYDYHFVEDSKADVYGFVIKLNDQVQNTGFINAIGAPFTIQIPEWNSDEYYDFDWNDLKHNSNPYEMLFKQIRN